MKLLVVFVGIFAFASAQFNNLGRQPPSPARPTPAPVINRVASSDQGASILRYDNDAAPDGSFSYGIETDNGISAQARGTPRDFGGNPPVVPVVFEGAFGWTSPEGQPIAISYIADENGYQPSGDALPTPPPTPEAILRALEYLSRIQQKK